MEKLTARLKNPKMCKSECIEKLFVQLTQLWLQYSRESVYGSDQFSNSQYLFEQSEIFRKGAELCRLFIKNHICFDCLYEQMSKLDLTEFLPQCNDYKPCTNK